MGQLRLQVEQPSVSSSPASLLPVFARDEGDQGDGGWCGWCGWLHYVVLKAARSRSTTYGRVQENPKTS